MNFHAFTKAFSSFPILSVEEIERLSPGYDRNALTRWQKSGYLQKIRNGYYRLTDRGVIDQREMYFIANRIYQPSYVSLQSALSWHGLIPEGVFTTTSVSTKKRILLNTPIGAFSYKSMKPECFFGYQLESAGDVFFKIAKPEKAIMDLLYFQPELNRIEQFDALRIKFFESKEKVSADQMTDYLSLLKSKSMDQRAGLLIKYLQNNDGIK